MEGGTLELWVGNDIHCALIHIQANTNILSELDEDSDLMLM